MGDIRCDHPDASDQQTETIVTNAKGAVIAASDPRQHPVGSIIKPKRAGSEALASFSFNIGGDSASAVRVLSYPGRVAGIIYATFDTRHLAAERRDVVIALTVTNGILTILLAVAGWFLVARMMRPVSILSEHLGVAQETLAVPIAESVVAKTRGEFGRLFRAATGVVLQQWTPQAIIGSNEFRKYFTDESLRKTFARHGLSVMASHNLNVYRRGAMANLAAGLVRLPLCGWLLDYLPRRLIYQRLYAVA